jgi:hypothetical protein
MSLRAKHPNKSLEGAKTCENQRRSNQSMGKALQEQKIYFQSYGGWGTESPGAELQ